MLFVPFYRSKPDWLYYYAGSMALSAVNTVVSVGALCWLGLWFGLRASGQARPILWSVGLGRGIPYALGILCSTLANIIFAPSGGLISPIRWVFSSFGPQIVSLAFSLGLIALARRQLQQELLGEPPLSLRQVLRRGAAAFRRTRHWTPGGV
jgi:hypothetical protein